MNEVGIRESFELAPESLLAYLESIGLARTDERCVVRELGGGVSNIVLLAEWPDTPERRWVVKQSLAKLRVDDDWRSERGRIFREAEALDALQRVLRGSLPRVIHLDRRNYLYVMTAAPPGSVVWKDSLLAGLQLPGIAHEAGVLLARMIRCGTGVNDRASNPLKPGKSLSPAPALPSAEAEKEPAVSAGECVSGRLKRQLETQFADRTVFDQLRIDPYYRSTAARHPDVAPALRRLIKDSWAIRTSLVHGDYSPKNILVRDGRIVLIDFEVVHWGDPAFDAGFLLTHLSLKALYQPRFLQAYVRDILDFWSALQGELALSQDSDFEHMSLRHLGALMLARIDGKSPVEYIHGEESKDRIRNLAKRIIFDKPRRLEDVVEMLRSCT